MSSVVNSSSTPLAANTSFTGAWEFLSTEKHGVQAICSTDASGTLLIEFSQNKIDINYTHTFAIEVDVSFARSVKKKGNYYRTILNNGPSPQTTLQLISIIETDFEPDTLDITLDAATSSVTVFGTDDTGTKRAVKTTSTGELVISGGGGSGGDASAANQVSSNLAICTRLDTIDTTLSGTLTVDVNNQLDISGLATSAIQQSSNLAQWTELNLIGEISEDLLLSVDGISAKMNALQIQSGKYTIEAVSQFAPDTTPTFSSPPAGIAKDEGWYYKNLLNGQVSQLYFYSYLNPAFLVAARQFAYQLNDITMSYCVVKLIAVNSTEGLVTLGIYTRPTGSGDAIPGFAKSRKVYNIPSTAKLTQGMEVMLYWGLEPSLKLHPNVARIQLQLASTIGPALGTEQLAFLSLNTDSATLAGNAEYVVSAAGFQYGAELIMDTQFTGESSASVAGGDASSANQVSSNTAICSRLDEQNTLSNSIVQILSDTVAVINYGIVTDSPPTYIPIKASNTGNLFVYDTQTHGELLTLNSQIDGVIDDTAGALKVVGDFYQASQPVEFETPQSVNLYSGGAALTYTQTGASQYSLDVNVNNSSIPVTGEFWQATQPVSIEKLSFAAGDELVVYDGYTLQELQTLNGKITKCDTDNVVISGTVPISSASALSVTETNPITDYATETTSALIKAQTDKLSFYADVGAFDLRTQVMNEIGVSVNNTPTVSLSSGTEVSLISGTQVGLSSGAQVQLTNSEVSLVSGTTVGLSAGTSVDANITNASIPITSASTLDTNITNTSLDVHGYASSDGNTWHHLASDANGRLNVNARAHSGTGQDITATVVTGTVTYTALDVAVKNAVAVTGSVTASANQYGSYGNLANNVASILTGGVTSGIDVSAWSYFVGAYEDYNGATVGTISLEYSFDNITYYTLFNTQIFPSGTGTPRRANINKQDIPAVNWIRLRNGTTSTLASVTVTLLGGSLS
jgi:hypothetical protein